MSFVPPNRTKLEPWVNRLGEIGIERLTVPVSVAIGTGDRMRMFGQENQRLETVSLICGVQMLTSRMPISTPTRQTRP